MSSFLLETAPGSTAKLIGDISPTFIFKISLIAVILYISTLEIGYGGKNGFLARLRKFKRLAELVNKYPGPNFYPLIGSAPEMLHIVFQPCRDLFPWMQNMRQCCGPIFKFWAFNQPKIFITCSETAFACLKGDSFPGRTSELMEIGKAAGGEGLIVIAPDVHGPRKKMWKQWFTRRIINGNLETFQKEASRLSEVLSTETNKTFDIVDYALHCTFRTIACSAFGEEYINHIPEAAAKQHFHGLTTFSMNLFNRAFRPWLANDFIYYYLTGDGRNTRRCIKTAHELTHNAIKHGKMLRTNKIRQMDSNGNIPCFLDHLLDIHEQGELTENEIYQELNNFLIAGYDTNGLALSWTLYLLALHPECQNKIVDELCEVFNGSVQNFSSQVNPKHLQNMKYLELCIKESGRLYPPLGMLFRGTVNKDAVMPDGNVLPPGVDVHIPLRIIHKDPKYFPEPEKFIPERHLVSIPAYMPFGLGSRSCVGQVYAIQELKMILAYLLMEYKWETLEKPGLEPLMNPMSYPENGIRFTISKRSYI